MSLLIEKKIKKNRNSLLMKILNLFIKKGFKTKAYNILLNCLCLLKKKYITINILNYLNDTLMKIQPIAELKILKLGSSKYYIPTPLSKSRKILLALIF